MYGNEVGSPDGLWSVGKGVVILAVGLSVHGKLGCHEHSIWSALTVISEFCQTFTPICTGIRFACPCR